MSKVGKPENNLASCATCATAVTTQSNSPGFTIQGNSILVIHAADSAENMSGISTDSNKHFVLIHEAKSAYDAAYLLYSLNKKIAEAFKDCSRQ
jgi:hypothetical protein